MALFRNIQRFFTRRPDQMPRLVKATRYDALTNNDLLNHWRWADNLSIDASLNSETRRQLRNRARYEVANNSYALGVALAISNAVVGSGARLQILAGLEDREIIKRVEWEFSAWATAVNLPEKLRSMRFARFQDGESFAILHTNERLKTPVKLDVMPIDAERVSAQYLNLDPLDIDGIKIDEDGNPVSYRVLTRHPGAVAVGTAQYITDATLYPANQIIHWFRRTSPEQHRGAPEITASLNLFALLRRYTLAVVTAAETAADFAAIMYTDAPGDYNGPTYDGKPFETYNIERGLMMTAPDGWKVSQLKAEQPTTTYSEFKREILGEIGRSLQIPVNIIAGDSSRYNYASGRLDHQEYQKAVRIDQAQASAVVMRPIFNAWWREYSILNNLPRTAPTTAFYWDGFEHVDPVKEASAQQIRLADLTSNLSIEYGKQGRDWEEELIQIKRERDKMAELGILPTDVSVAENFDDDNDDDKRI